jgi:hypothetical protein
MKPRRIASGLAKTSCLAALFFALVAAHAQNSSKDSPFLPPSSAAQNSPSAASAYALTGMTVVGKDTLLSITNQSDKRSVWIPVGKTEGDITAVSYDAAKETAVIRAGGQSYNLTLKKGAVLPGPAMPLPQVTAPSTAAAPAATLPAVEVPKGNLSPQEEKEMEARMLVTDLLEIGQQQRKAYAEAQRQAAAKGSGKPPVAPTPTPAPTTSTKK